MKSKGNFIGNVFIVSAVTSVIFLQNHILTFAQGENTIYEGPNQKITNTNQVINIPDPELKKAIISQLKLANHEIINNEITVEDIEKLTWLDGTVKNIKNLSGLEYAINIDALFLAHNQISSVQPLENLNKLKILTLDNNNIEDIIPLKNLTNLTCLTLYNNNINDVSYLQNLKHLAFLDLNNNKIENIDALSNLTNLETLSLGKNKISDISCLKNLKNFKNLIEIDLSCNQISNFPNELLNLEKASDMKLYSQRITNRTIGTSSLITIKNPIYIFGEYKQPTYISDGGKLNGENITWENIDKSKLLNFKYDGYFMINGKKISIDIVVTQPVGKDLINILDIKGHWAEYIIKDFINEEYINGYPDNTFKPESRITRAEFVKIFNKKFGLENTSGKVFSDTRYHWAKDEIDIAVTNGVCKGKSTTEFDPDGYLTREEAAKMIANYKKISDSNHDKLNSYNDCMNVSDWAKDAVESVIEEGYMNGYGEDNTYRPTNNITRAEAVVTLSRVE